MKCKKCGKRLRKNEGFCSICGFYNGDFSNNEDWDSEDLDLTKEEYKLTEQEEIPSKAETWPSEEENKDKKEDKFDLKADSSGTKEDEFYYEDENFLEAYIGEDYKLIKKMPFNIYAFLLNWMYLLYRKLYITGGIGLLITLIVILFLPMITIPYIIITLITLGFAFNKYYIFIAKKRIEKIKNNCEDSDKFTIASTCQEKGGVNIPYALGIYFIFLVIILINVININYNKDSNTKFWKENSENKANCSSLTKTAYQELQKNNQLGTLSESACRVIKGKPRIYNIYFKMMKNNKIIYVHYQVKNSYITYKNNTENQNDLELKKANHTITPEENTLLEELKKIEDSYIEIKKRSKEEDDLIHNKKNESEKINFIFTNEETIR